eukprot:XP_022280720.1 uncharacterized protein LOC102154209 isoform X2 [Canis lupus familiaris]
MVRVVLLTQREPARPSASPSSPAPRSPAGPGSQGSHHRPALSPARSCACSFAHLRNANTSARGRILGAVPSPSGRFRLLLGVSVSRWEPRARTIRPGNCRRRLASSLLTF